MDRYERILQDVQRKTETGSIRWRVVQPSRYAGVILNAARVLRVFEARYPIGGGSYLLLFVERKTESHEDFSAPTETLELELLILDEDEQIVLLLFDGLVDRDDLLRLGGLIGEHNDRAQQFFRAFDESGAA